MKTYNGITSELVGLFRTLTYRHMIFRMDSPKRRVIRLFFCLIWAISDCIPLLFVPIFVSNISFLTLLLLLVGYPNIQELSKKMRKLVLQWDEAILNEYKSVYQDYITRRGKESMLSLKIMKSATLDTYVNSIEISKKQFFLAIEEMATIYPETPYKLRTLKFATMVMTIVLGGWFTSLVSGNIFVHNTLANCKDVSAILFLIVITACFAEYNVIKLSRDIEARRNRELRLFLIEYGYEKYGTNQ